MKSELRDFLLVVKDRVQDDEKDHVAAFSILMSDYLDAQDEKIATYEGLLTDIKFSAALNSDKQWAVNVYRRISEFLK